MLVVGFGGGVALEGVPPSVESVDVVELEPEVIEANRQLTGMRDNDPLEDPRFNVVINDARNALRLTGQTYDAIVSQPSHPWTAGASHLFTREFAADVRSHLNEGGVFLQWMNDEFVDEPLLRTLAATLTAVFEYVRLYYTGAGVLMFMASDAPLDIELQAARTGRPFSDHPMHYGLIGLNGVEDLLVALALDEEGVLSFSRRAELSTDDNNLMATRSRSRADGLQIDELLELLEPHDPLARQGSWVHALLAGQLDYGYMARWLMSTGRTARATDMAEAIPDFSRQFEVFGLLFQATGQADRAPESLNNALRANPQNVQARYAIVKDDLAELSRGAGPEDIRAVAAELTGPAAAVIPGIAYETLEDWASLAALDEALAGTRITDAWYGVAVRLRAAWRVNATEDRERLAQEALDLLERALVLYVDADLHRLRAMASRTLGDANGLLESSSHLASAIGGELNDAASRDYWLLPEAQARTRRSLEIIAEQLGGDLEVADPERLATVHNAVNELIQYLDDYPQEQ